ncbi:MAG: helix-turn-helix domain-containing protein, partial [Bacteroidota bacterium]
MFRKIKFDREKNPNAPHLDILPYEEIRDRDDLYHFPWMLHRVDFYIVILVLSGKGAHTVDFTDYALEPGTILTIRRDQVHKFVNSDARGHMLIFTEEFIQKHLDQQEALKTLQLFNELLGSPRLILEGDDLEEVLQLIQHMQREFFDRQDEFSPGINRSLLHVLISKLYRHKAQQAIFKEDPPYLPEFIQFQRLVEAQGLTNRTVQSYAQQMGMSTKTLNKIVQRIVHKTAKTFVDEVAILQIKRLLSHSHYSIKQIAYQAGFDEPTNL